MTVGVLTTAAPDDGRLRTGNRFIKKSAMIRTAALAPIHARRGHQPVTRCESGILVDSPWSTLTSRSCSSEENEVDSAARWKPSERDRANCRCCCATSRQVEQRARCDSAAACVPADKDSSTYSKSNFWKRRQFIVSLSSLCLAGRKGSVRPAKAFAFPQWHSGGAT